MKYLLHEREWLAIGGLDTEQVFAITVLRCISKDANQITSTAPHGRAHCIERELQHLLSFTSFRLQLLTP